MILLTFKFAPFCFYYFGSLILDPQGSTFKLGYDKIDFIMVHLSVDLVLTLL